MELALTACLWLLITKHRSDIIQLTHIRLTIQLVLYIRTYYTGSPLRTQGHTAVAFIKKCIHFLLYDICCFTNSPFEQ
ncbi:hypothetical protein D3C73_883840 [compost metagenome]